MYKKGVRYILGGFIVTVNGEEQYNVGSVTSEITITER